MWLAARVLLKYLFRVPKLIIGGDGSFSTQSGGTISSQGIHSGAPRRPQTQWPPDLKQETSPPAGRDTAETPSASASTLYEHPAGYRTVPYCFCSSIAQTEPQLGLKPCSCWKLTPQNRPVLFAPESLTYASVSGHNPRCRDKSPGNNTSDRAYMYSGGMPACFVADF